MNEHATTWFIRVHLDDEWVLITATGSDPQYPSSLHTNAHGPRAEELLREIAEEAIYPPQDMKWMLQSENDMYGWHAATGSVIDRRRGEKWKVDHNLP